MPTKIPGFGAKIWKLVKRDEFLPKAAKTEVLSLSQHRTVSAQFIFLQINDIFLVRKKNPVAGLNAIFDKKQF